MTEHLQYWAGRCVLDGLYFEALEVLERNPDHNISRIVKHCNDAALHLGVSPEQICDYDFAKRFELDEI